MLNSDLPNWLVNLETEDLSLIKRFIIASGSFKELAKEYNISYPTIRLRLDKLIEKIKLFDTNETDAYIEKVKSLAIDDRIDLETAKLLITEYRKVKK